jgi:hypothetical protein
MTLPRTQSSYGSPKKQARTGNPIYDLCAPEWNRAAADLAALTQTPTKLRVRFPTATSNGAITPAWFAAAWGDDPANAPAVARTATGIYTISTPSSWASPGVWVYSIDPEGAVSTSEQVIWTDAEAKIWGSVASTASGNCRESISGYTVTVYIYDNTWALSDLGGGVPIRLVAA